MYLLDLMIRNFNAHGFDNFFAYDALIFGAANAVQHIYSTKWATVLSNLL